MKKVGGSRPASTPKVSQNTVKRQSGATKNLSVKSGSNAPQVGGSRSGLGTGARNSFSTPSVAAPKKANGAKSSGTGNPG